MKSSNKFAYPLSSLIFLLTWTSSGVSILMRYQLCLFSDLCIEIPIHKNEVTGFENLRYLILDHLTTSYHILVSQKDDWALLIDETEDVLLTKLLKHFFQKQKVIHFKIKNVKDYSFEL